MEHKRLEDVPFVDPPHGTSRYAATKHGFWPFELIIYAMPG